MARVCPHSAFAATVAAGSGTSTWSAFSNHRFIVQETRQMACPLKTVERVVPLVEEAYPWLLFGDESGAPLRYGSGCIRMESV